MMDEKTNWEAISKLDFRKIKEEMISDKEAFVGESNKKLLLKLILKATGIKFTDITMNDETDYTTYPKELHTNSTRPELGVCTRWIDEFQFELFSRTPETITLENGEARVYLRYCPALGYTYINGGTNGFEIKEWFYYDCYSHRWILK